MLRSPTAFDMLTHVAPRSSGSRRVVAHKPADARTFRPPAAFESSTGDFDIARIGVDSHVPPFVDVFADVRQLHAVLANGSGASRA